MLLLFILIFLNFRTLFHVSNIPVYENTYIPQNHKPPNSKNQTLPFPKHTQTQSQTQYIPTYIYILSHPSQPSPLICRNGAHPPIHQLAGVKIVCKHIATHPSIHTRIYTYLNSNPSAQPIYKSIHTQQSQLLYPAALQPHHRNRCTPTETPKIWNQYTHLYMYIACYITLHPRLVLFTSSCLIPQPLHSTHFTMPSILLRTVDSHHAYHPRSSYLYRSVVQVMEKFTLRLPCFSHLSTSASLPRSIIPASLNVSSILHRY